MTSQDIDLQDRPRRLPRLADAVPDAVRRRDQAEARDYSRYRVVGAAIRAAWQAPLPRSSSSPCSSPS